MEEKAAFVKFNFGLVRRLVERVQRADEVAKARGETIVGNYV